jgi:hypothetical protein
MPHYRWQAACTAVQGILRHWPGPVCLPDWATLLRRLLAPGLEFLSRVAARKALEVARHLPRGIVVPPPPPAAMLAGPRVSARSGVAADP